MGSSNKNKLSRKFKCIWSGEWGRHRRGFLKALGNRTFRRADKLQIKKSLENGI